MSRITSVRFAIFLLLAAAASAQLKTFGDLSFSVPAGYAYEFVPGDDHATLRIKNGSTFCILVIYHPIRSSGDAETDFKATWPRLLGKSAGPGVPTPIYDFRTQTGYPGKQSGYTSADRKNYFWLYTLEAGRDFIPVVVLTTGRPVLDSQQSIITRFVEGVRQGPVNAPPANTNQATKKTITLADLTGEWRHDGALFIIAADGRYESRFTGLSNGRTVREKSVGVVQLGGEFIVFRDNPGPQEQRYRFISYESAVNGSTVLTLLTAGNAVNSSNIALYAEKWIRAPTAK